jgi:hypothetical protein
MAGPGGPARRRHKTKGRQQPSTARYLSWKFNNRSFLKNSQLRVEFVRRAATSHRPSNPSTARIPRHGHWSSVASRD